MHAKIALLLSVFLPASAAAAAPAGVCDIFASGGTPCVAAHSLVRALFSLYASPLYQVTRLTDNRTLDVIPQSAGGVADVAPQDAFCAGAPCEISTIYDQSGSKNHLSRAPAGGNVHHPTSLLNASRLPVAVAGSKAYGGYFEGNMGYRIDETVGVAKGNDPETLYMVTDGTHVNEGCCFDYGNAETNNNDDGAGTMEAIYFGSSVEWGHGAGAGPWVMADLENGLWAGENRTTLSNTPLTHPFVFAMVKGGTNGFALKGGDATTGALSLMYDGPRPHGYQPMKKQGSIILGIGGDNSNRAVGTWYEGAITAGYTSDATDDAVAANVAAAGFGK